uniref:BRCT domain-containing protein n=1 Tax=Sus scrofa TaxID=9823 RepID=A0A8D1M977_PIG
MFSFECSTEWQKLLEYLVESKLKTQKNQPSLKSLKTNNKPEKSKYKPLWGKVFYIDLPSVTLSEKLQKDIKDLGGRVEEFLILDPFLLLLQMFQKSLNLKKIWNCNIILRKIPGKITHR